MRHIVIEEDVNLEEYPENCSDFPLSPSDETTIGDIHANSLKFLYFLTRHKIIEIPKADYQRFVNIYKTPAENLTKEHLAEFENILNNIEVKLPLLIRLLGDDLADWGSNDYFILKLIKKLVLNNSKIEILLSNHTIEFLNAFERGLNCSETYPYLKTRLSFPIGQDASLQGLATLLKNNLVTKDEVTELVTKYYLPCLKIFSYSLDEKEQDITFYSHGHAGIATLKALAKKFDDKSDDNPNLFDLVKQTNQNLHSIISQKKLQEFSQLDAIDGVIRLEKAGIEYPLAKAIWHQGYEDFEFPKQWNGYKLHYATAHSGNGLVPDQFADYIQNFDNSLGKGIHAHKKGKYSVMFFSNQSTGSRAHPTSLEYANLNRDVLSK